MEVLEQRLRDRKTDSEESISTRLFKVKFEMSFEDKFDVTLVNNDLNEVLVKAQQLVDDFIKK
jgi:guanylate kinase